MAFYEHTIVGKQDLSEKEVENLISKYSKIIDKSGKVNSIHTGFNGPATGQAYIDYKNEFETEIKGLLELQ